jgi:pimeloyl-ACP methyl ester carboxylesterase
VKYALTRDGASLAYQSFGEGSVDMVVIPPFAQNVELAWERPEIRRLFARFAGFARVVQFDKRGTGMSDRTAPVPGLDQRVDDTRAVMDAAGVDRAVLYGVSEGGPMAMMFAVTYPERVSSLILNATSARPVPSSYPVEERERRRFGVDGLFTGWGTERSRILERFAPSLWSNPSYRAWEPRYERHCATPVALRQLIAMIDEIDVTDVLARIAVPTLILHRIDDPVIAIDEARRLAAAIDGAKLVELDGIDHFPHAGDMEPWLVEVERFVTGQVRVKRNAVQLDAEDGGDGWSGGLGPVGVSGPFDMPLGHLAFDQSRG